MAYKYESAVPWGRSFDEYVEMFELTDRDLQGRILGCADGPAAFNATMAERGRFVVSCDPLYQFSESQIRTRIDETYDNIIEQTYRNVEKFVWTRIRSVEELGQLRRASMENFLADYDRGRHEGRYITSELPHLPFAPQAFDLAICSHFLFLYSPILSLSFHLEAVSAMCSVARDVRIFPLLTYDAEPSPYLEKIMQTMRDAGRTVRIESASYEFQRGGDKMLRILSS
jgi:hypothetical protein